MMRKHLIIMTEIMSMVILDLTTKWKVVAVHLDVVLEVLDPREGVAVAAEISNH